MAMYNLSRAEQETIIRWDAETRTASIDSADPVTIRKLDKLVLECPEAYQLIHTDELYGAKRYAVPAKYVRFGKPVSEERREAARQSCNLRRETTVNTDVS